MNKKWIADRRTDRGYKRDLDDSFKKLNTVCWECSSPVLSACKGITPK